MIFLISALISAAYADNYGPALDKAKDAALIQTGIQANIDKAKAMGEAQAKKTAYDLGVDKELGVGIVAYKIYKDKAISFPLDKTKHITIHEDRLELKISF